MTDTSNLGLPFIEASQAQKHVTHNEALRILDAVIQIAVLDATRTAPPASPVEGQRHIVAASPTGAWTGRAKSIATWQDGAWAFAMPKTGWCVWSVAGDVTMVFDGTAWRDQRNLALDNAARLGVNTAAASPNLLSVRSNAALLAAINAADGGSGDTRLQLSKESAAKTASVYFSNAFAGRAEFGLVGSDAFRLKVSADGSSWVDGLTIDQTSGSLTLPRALALTGVIAPPQITANQNDFAPSGIAAASVIQLSTDAARTLSGLSGGAEGRVMSLVNVGSQTLTLLDENASSVAANRFSLGAAVAISARQAALLRYDGTALRWQALARPPASGVAGSVAPPQGRLTLQSGAPFMSGSQAGKATLYYTPFCGNQIPLYDGTSLVSATFAELSAATSDTTKNPGAIAASKLNDWFVWSDGGTLRLSHGPDWTNDTTRSAGTALTRASGILLNSVGITNGPAASRGTYVGTTRSDASSLLNWIPGGAGAGGSAPFLHVWNAHNRITIGAVTTNTSSGTYTSNTIRQFGGSSGMQINFISGLPEEGVQWAHSTEVVIQATTGAYAITGVGFNTTSAFSSPRVRLSNQTSTSILAAIETSSGVWSPAAGSHFLSFNQQGDGASANEFNNTGDATLTAVLRM